MNNYILEINNLKKNYRNESETLEILKSINFTLSKGETISITGESGSGKSTFLHMIAGLDNVTEGSIKIENTEVTQLDEKELSFYRNKKIGYIFQSHYLLEEFNALENVMLPYLMHNFNKKLAKEKALGLLDFVGLSHRINHKPSRLSGGERQRVAIARAFINEPPLILADEPTGNLDEKNAEKVLKLLFDISKEKQHSLIIVTHSTHTAKLAGTHYHLEDGKLFKA